jgi:phosphoribosylformylglycinamidine cyclo-ligase
VIQPLLATPLIKGMAHITGGGITDNLPRVLPGGTHAEIDRSAWTVPPVFHWLQTAGRVPDDDMLRTFNMGIGLIVVSGAEDADALLDGLARSGERDARRIGVVRPAGEGVRYVTG